MYNKSYNVDTRTRKRLATQPSSICQLDNWNIYSLDKMGRTSSSTSLQSLRDSIMNEDLATTTKLWKLVYFDNVNKDWKNISTSSGIDVLYYD